MSEIRKMREFEGHCGEEIQSSEIIPRINKLGFWKAAGSDDRVGLFQCPDEAQRSDTKPKIYE